MPHARAEPESPWRSQRNAAKALLFAFGCVIAAFIASTVYVQINARRIDQSAFEIASDSAPSVVHLSAVRADASRLEALLVDHRGPTSPALRDEVPLLIRGIEDGLAAYYALPVSDAERAVIDRTEALALGARIHQASDAMLKRLDAGDRPGALLILDRDLRPTSARLVGAAVELIALNAQRTHDLALHIRELRERSMDTALELDASIAVLSAMAAVIAVRVGRQHARVVEEHGRLVEARAAELEQFAGRVAHDVLSPLQAAQTALEIVRLRSRADRAMTGALDRGDAAIRRVARVVEGLLGFARAGARPATDARAEVRPVLDEILGELKPRAEAAEVAIVSEAPAGVAVACDGAILSVILGNLAQNALKYMGSAPERRISVRASARVATVHIEVEDTGPGLPPGLGAHVFEPYVRGRGRTEPGIGLGLATVKRIVEAHGGDVGVRAGASSGCLFWVDLPRAT